MLYITSGTRMVATMPNSTTDDPLSLFRILYRLFIMSSRNGNVNG
jgi:hypothetical protein